MIGESWTLGKRIAAGFAAALLALIAIGVVVHRTTTVLLETRDWVSHTHIVLEKLAEVQSLMQDAESGSRGFVITGEDAFLAPYEGAKAATGIVNELLQLTADNPHQRPRLERLQTLIDAEMEIARRHVEARRTQGLEASVKLVSAKEGASLMDQLRHVLGELSGEERSLLAARDEAAQVAGQGAKTTILAGDALALVLVGILAWVVIRSLTRQIGDAVQRVQSSSAELQAASSQQAVGAQEQAQAMTEISTTIGELLVTSRQIAESAQNVAKIADSTAAAGKAGDGALKRTEQSVGEIRRQVDVIVAHMLELGRKSQQIGAVLELINELSDQTNIVAINATIEAAGAGEAGARFGAVANEIRKLADRVASSTKDIRGLIDEVRGAVNTTVMATESGSKAVDAGARRFVEVNEAFRTIAELVENATEAARRIELSTKQQATAVAQVNVAIGSVAQASKEAEVSSGQTLETASELNNLSQKLKLLIEAPAPA